MTTARMLTPSPDDDGRDGTPRPAPALVGCGRADCGAWRIRGRLARLAAVSGVELEYLPPAGFDLTAVRERLPAPLHVDSTQLQSGERAYYDTFDCRLRAKQLRLIHENGFLRLFGAGGRELGAVAWRSPSETIRPGELGPGPLRDT